VLRNERFSDEIKKEMRGGSELNSSKKGTHYWNVVGCSGTVN
jgi:hypothetical protein